MLKKCGREYNLYHIMIRTSSTWGSSFTRNFLITYLFFDTVNYHLLSNIYQTLGQLLTIPYPLYLFLIICRYV